jgi:hypothetical protein
MSADQSPRRGRRPRDPIPEFASREEEVRFWDTHDLADYWDDFEPVELRFSENLSQDLTIRLDEASLKELRQRAREQGIGPTALARLWVLERLKQVQ